MDGLKIELFMVGYTKDNQCMDGWKDGLLEPCSLELVKHSGTNNQLPAPPALSAVSNHFSSPPTYFPHFPPWLLFVFLTCECETELPPLPPPADMDQLRHWPRPGLKECHGNAEEWDIDKNFKQYITLKRSPDEKKNCRRKHRENGKEYDEEIRGGMWNRRVKYEPCQSAFATEEATWAEQEEKQST